MDWRCATQKNKSGRWDGLLAASTVSDLRPGDTVTGVDVVEPDADLLVVTEFGIGKRTLLDEYHPKGRGSQGSSTITQASMDTIGTIAAARVVTEKDDLTLISTNGVVIRLKVDKINRSGRATRGTHIMNLEKDDRVASIARIITLENGDGNGTNPEPTPLEAEPVLDEVIAELPDEIEPDIPETEEDAGQD